MADPKLYPLLADSSDRRERIREKTVEGLQSLFPIIGKKYELHVDGVDVNREQYSNREQKDALLRGNSLYEFVKGNLTLKDKLTGQILETKKNHTLAQLPYFTERHTFIVGGNEYDLPNQLRLKSGVYTRERGNGELEASFNLSKGTNFRIAMEPQSGKLYMEMGTSRIPLYPVLKSLGVPDIDISNILGADLKNVNAGFGRDKEEIVLNKLIKKLKYSSDPMPATIEAKKQWLQNYFANTKLDPNVTKSTLGQSFSSVTPHALMAASNKLVRVYKGEAKPDDRDSLEFKSILSTDDFFKERLDKDARRTAARKIQHKINTVREPTIADVIPSSTFTKSLNSFITTSALASTPMQINPIEIIDHSSRVTSLGEGGIESDRAIPYESRKIHNSHLGILDPTRTPEGFKAGIDVRVTTMARRDAEGNMYTKLYDPKTGTKRFVSVVDTVNKNIAFPNQDPTHTHLDVVRGADVVSVKREDVDFILPNTESMFSPSTGLVPLLNNMQGNRGIMGSKFQTQALPLKAREAPYVQSGYGKSSMETELAKLVVPTARESGTVVKIDKDFIYIRPDSPIDTKTSAFVENGIRKLTYDTHFPLASKTHLHNELTVKEGDKVTAGQQLAESNFTRDGQMALGKNMSIAYMAYYGKNSNDAVVISQGAAEKLISEHMYKETLYKSSDILTGKSRFKAYYGQQYTAAQLDKLDENGVAKPGQVFNYKDPVILALRKSPPTPEATLLGKFSKSLVKPYRDASVIWEHTNPGTVIDAVNANKQISVTLTTDEPMKVGDKLSNRFGGKGVVSEIIPDEQMVKDGKGKPIDILFTSAGIISRINPSQVVEAALGKVVEKTGKPIVLPQFMQEDSVQYAKKLLKEHGLKDKETVYDPISGKKIPNVFVGRSYIHKLFKSTETNYAARGATTYDINGQPIKGGDEGAKGIGTMEFNTLLAHNARNVIKDAVTLKSEKNDAYWRAIELGLPPPPLKTPFVADKFVTMLQGAGINVNKQGNKIALGPLTDKDIEKMSSGALDVPSLEKSRSFMVNAKTLKPERGGLFDPTVTGGLSGTRWSHLDLSEPVLNPLFSEPARALLGYTKVQLRDRIGEVGGAGIKRDLNAIDLEAKRKELEHETRTSRNADLDKAVKQLKYVKSLQSIGVKAGDAYVLSKLPVTPPIIRPIIPSSRGGELQVSDANYLYRDAGLASEALRSIKETGLTNDISSARHHLYDATGALFGTDSPVSPQLQGRGVKGYVEQITGAGSPKSGFFHKKILKRTQDLSGRATATPDGTLNMDQIGVPEDMLWQTYGKFIMQGLNRQGYTPLDASKMIEDRHPMARSVLDKELQTRPVFVNRAPSLHRHNFVAAYAIPVPGKSLRINPFIEPGMNLDYDGDAMQVHVPASDAAAAEARKLTISNLLFTDKSRDNLIVFPQHEALIGAYLATKDKASGPIRKFKNRAEAMEAYKRNEIDLNTPVEIG